MQRAILAAICLSVITPLAAAQEVSGQREFSTLVVHYTVSDTVAQVNVDVSLAGLSVDHAVLTYAAPNHEFSVKVGESAATGTFDFHVAMSPSLSGLAGKFVVRNGTKESFPFEGEVASWSSSGSLILLQSDFYLSGEFFVRTVVRNGSRYGAEVEFIDGDIFFFDVVLLPPSPIATTPTDFIIGTFKLTRGAQVTLTPPSVLSNEMVLLECTFSTPTAPSTDFAGAVSFWALDPTGAVAPY